MIHYHGLPITSATVAVAAVSGGHAFVSYRYPSQLSIALTVCQSFACDNSAFSAWRSGAPVSDWTPYYDWISELHRYPNYDFCVIPDVIDGSEADNDRLIDEFPWKHSPIGAPVWHMHESLARLDRLCSEYYRVCIGSSGQFASVGDAKWWVRMRQAMHVVCDKSGRPICKLHGLRMLNPKVYSELPLSSADSCNIAMNVGKDDKWKGTYTPATKESRAMVMRQRIESGSALSFWTHSKLDELSLVMKSLGLTDDELVEMGLLNLI